MGPDHRKSIELEGRGLSVADIGFAGLVDENAARRTDALRPSEIEHPPDHIEHVNAHVAHDSVAILHEGAPAAGMNQLVVGSHRRRARPHLVIQVVGRRGVRRVFAGAHVIIAVDLDQADLAQFTFLDDLLAGLDEVGRASTLGADLHDALVFAGGRQHGLAFQHIHADGFLAVDIQAGLASGDHGQRMPMIGCGDEDQVDVLLFQQFAVIMIGARPLL
jgi:hypothetical protein